VRNLRTPVLEALDARVKQFRTREALWPLRVPPEPLPFADVIHHALPGAPRFDPLSLRARTLLDLTWDDGSAWSTWVIVLPSNVKVYCDSGAEGTRVLASGGRNEGEESDRIFLQLLAESGGLHFGLEMSGGPPARVRSSIADREFLVDLFVELFEGTDVEAALRDPCSSIDFRDDVARWLESSTGR
jgi:hypothetical protein